MTPGTALGEMVLAVFSAASASCGSALTEQACIRKSCGPQARLSNVPLSAGVTYFILAEHEAGHPLGTAPLSVGLQVSGPSSTSATPANDVCAGALPLTLDVPSTGLLGGAADNYRLSGAACFTGLDQTATTAPGGDAIWSFTAPSPGSYSFRAQATGSSGPPDLVLYTGTSCPTAPPLQTLTCSAPVVASNRSTD